MSQKIDGKKIYTILSNEIYSEIERIAKKRKLTIAATVRMLLKGSITLHQDMEKVGVIQLIDFIDYVKSAGKKERAEHEPTQLKLY